MIARRCSGAAAALVVAVALLAGCGSASSTPAVCTDAANLKSAVLSLKDTDVRTGGLSAISDELTKIQQQLDTLKNSAKGQYSTQITDLSNALSGLSSSLGAARDTLNAGTLSALASAAGSVVTAGNNLVTAVSHTC
jgi:outer membrane murein-binding lipoprotein Lpp